MNPIVRVLIGAVVLTWGSAGFSVNASSLWGNLKPGPFEVGFRTVLTYDSSRPPIADASGAGRSVTRGRQMQIHVWYPARGARGAANTKFSDYVHKLAQDLEFESLTPERQKRSVEIFLEQPQELGGDAAKLRSALPTILESKMMARQSAAPAPGRFPLVVFPDFRAPATNSIMCEYLASHGFVVAASSLKGTREAELDVAVTGVETIAADIGFIIGTLIVHPAVDRSQIALIGVGITASGCLAQVTRNSQIDALISLDGGIPTAFEDRILKRTPYFDVANVRVPMLAIHAPHPNVDPSILDQYKYSTRHLVHFPKMSEFHFLNYGMLEEMAPGIIGKPPGNTRAGFEWASQYVLHFLKAYLKGDSGSVNFLRAAPEANGVERGLVSIQTKAGLRAPPTVPELKALVRRDGIKSVISLYQELKKADPQPFSQDTIVALYSWVSQRDPDWKARRELSALRLDSFPTSARAHFTMAQILVQMRERDLARNHFREALRLLDADPDSLLDFPTRRRIEQASKQGLKDLGS